ncbi:MAG: toll/interleukin-1 receptor domain-containing protein [Cryobacterium sp.]|nr:toll/interleukin-1 receptor domain-containing protein [Cryobacterium sp.]
MVKDFRPRLRTMPPAGGARIFLSHSSEDRDFAEKLALDLTQRGFRVWLDRWHMGIGEHLTQSVRGGVTLSAFLVVVLSPHTSKSKWVGDELAWATAQERAQGRKILLPVRIGGGKVPKQVRDRVYVDFSDSYSASLRQLESRLQAWSPARSPFDLAEVDIPIFLDDGLDVDVHTLGQCLDRQLPLGKWLPEGAELTAAQVHLQPSKTYNKLRRRALSRVERLPGETGLRPEERQSLSLHARRALALEEHLLRGAAKLLSFGIPMGAWSPTLSAGPVLLGGVCVRGLHPPATRPDPDDLLLPHVRS